MAIIDKSAQTKLIIESLELDRAHNYSRLEYYLKQIISGRDVTFETRSDTPITVSSQEAWEIIVNWSQGEGALPVGDRGGKIGMLKRASHLLDYIQTNVSGKTTEAAANYHLILEQANNSIPAFKSIPGDPQPDNLQKMLNLRKIQIQIQQAGLIGKIYTNLEKTKILEGVPEGSRKYVIQMLAAANQNFRYNPKDPTRNYTAEKIQNLLSHTPGIQDDVNKIHDINQVMRLLYSKSSQQDFETIEKTIESTILEAHKGNEKSYQAEMDAFYNLSALAPTLSNVEYMIDSVGVSSTPEQRLALIKSLRSQIITAATSSHQSGNTILLNALKNSGLPDSSAGQFSTLLPYLEEIEIKQRHLLLGSPTSKRDTRLLATLGLATDIGVDATIPWMKRRDLEEVTKKLAGGISLDSVQKAFDLEFAKGDSANFKKLSELSDLIGKHKDFNLYQNTVRGNLGYKFQETWSKGFGNYFAIKEPIDNLTEKVWGHIENVDDVIRWPARTVADWWEKTQENHPWLNPAAMISHKLVEYQTGIALKIHAWAIKVSTSNAWLKSFAGHVADFTEGFIKHDANWSMAGHFFVSRKFGNTLDWAAKTFTKHENFLSIKATIGKTIWNGFSKVAPDLATKMMSGTFKQAILAFVGGELTLGASIVVQIGFELIRSAFSFVGKFLSDHDFREKIIDRIPLIAGGLISGGIMFLSGIPAAIVAGIGIAGGAIFTLLQGAIMSLAPLFGLAGAVALGAVAFFSILWYGLISPTFQLDSGTALQQVAISLLCNSSGAEKGSSATANVALCIAEIASKCEGVNPMTKEVVNSSKWQCLVAGLVFGEATSELAKSANSQNWLQCVGLSAASAAGGGGAFSTGQRNACSYANINKPSGYQYLPGCPNMQPGDHFIMGADNCVSSGGSTVGHIGVVIKPEDGQKFTCVDANYGTDGLIRGPETCFFAKSEISGCLRKM